MILILGSSSIKTALYYKKLNLARSELVSSSADDYIVGHTSPQDAGTYSNLNKIANKAHQIYFAYPTPSEFNDLVFYYEYLDWIKEFQFRYKKILNWSDINLDDYKWNLNLPTLTKDDAVFIGCSFTEGVGIKFDHNKYANIVAKHYGLNCVNLGKKGSSNSYFFEIFSQLNFNHEQLVVLQLTVLERLRYCNHEGDLKNLQLGHLTTDYSLLEVYNNRFMFYETLKQIRLINSIAIEKKLKLAIWLDNYKKEYEGHYTPEQQRYFYNFRSYVPAYLMKNYLVDVASDNLHPGIESNKNIANTLIYFINKTYNEI